MPETARILKFPSRETRPSFRPDEARDAALAFLETPFNLRSGKARDEALSSADLVLALFGLLCERRETCPQDVLEEAEAIYEWVRVSPLRVGVFDERDYFLGESAHLAGVCSRLLGRREAAARWLDLAEASFRHTINSAPSMANIAYARLSLAFEAGRHHDLLELVPSVRKSFERLRMIPETAKCLLLEAMVLKGQGRIGEALAVLQPVRQWTQASLDSNLKGRILAEVGDLHQSENRFDYAIAAYREALPLLQAGGISQALADLKMFVGDVYRRQEKLGLALEAFRSAIADYQHLGMATRTAYLRVVLSETLIAADRPREAEWEILAALPTIEEQKMVPEGFAAVALLKESVRRRKTDPNALRELREHLKANQK